MRLAPFLIVVLGWLAPVAGWSQSPGSRLPEPVARALAQAGIPESGIGLYVHEIGADRPLVALGAERAFNPASTIKLVTTYAALDALGPAFVWNTEVYAAGPLERGVLQGDLILKGYGDPKLTLENFWLLLRNVRARGVREIRGDLMLDRSYFAREENDPGRFDDQPNRPYNTGPDALLVNFKAVRLQFVPEIETRSVKILVEPALPQLQIVNNLALNGGACGDWVNRLGTEVRATGNSMQLAFNGAFAASCGEKIRHVSVFSHPQYVYGLFNELWRELGGTLTGGVREGEVPPSARLMLATPSETLAEIVRDINKFSNNVMARQLFLTLGAAAFGAPATTDKAARAVRQWLAAKGLSFPELVLENGSGLSRVERISAKSLGQLLLHAFHSPVMPELIASLPLVAVDGTMRKRLRDAGVAGQAHIKTGSLANVRAIAGYVLDREGRRVVIVFLVNHTRAAVAQPVFDALLKWAYSRAAGDSGAVPRKALKK